MAIPYNTVRFRPNNYRLRSGPIYRVLVKITDWGWRIRWKVSIGGRGRRIISGRRRRSIRVRSRS